jgi:hypothetical protein
MKRIGCGILGIVESAKNIGFSEMAGFKSLRKKIGTTNEHRTNN